MGRILLVRHGQASSGAADYDVLSATGETQASLLGADLARRGLRPSVLASGELRRQRRTAELAHGAAGWDVVAEVDGRWNEFDHQPVYAAAGAPALEGGDASAVGARQDFAFDHALPRWVLGGHDDYPETFEDFSRRVDAAFDELVPRLGRGDLAVVVTSAGVISRVATRLIGAGPAQWLTLNRVAVNTAITTVVVGSRGATLISLNEHAHLRGPAVTYR